MFHADLTDLFHEPLPKLIEQAWKIREKRFAPEIFFAAPSAKKYESEYFSNSPNAFVHISVTGNRCSLMCEHCRGILLKSMVSVHNDKELNQLAQRLANLPAKGVLISGGADPEGRVPLKPFFNGMKLLKEAGIKVIVHSGLVDKETAEGLRMAGVDQVLLDIIGDRETIGDVCHLNKGPEDYLESLNILQSSGLTTVPHIVIGLNYGRLAGELAALAAVSSFRPRGIVLVVLTPRAGTPMSKLKPPDAEIVGKLLAITRVASPASRLMLGCARPSGPAKETYEAVALKAGANVIAYPTGKTVELAKTLGLKVHFDELCCSLL
jgi:uncharacterized radical SAM superfamily protein